MAKNNQTFLIISGIALALLLFSKPTMASARPIPQNIQKFILPNKQEIHFL